MAVRRSIGRVGALAAVATIGVCIPVAIAGAAPYPNGGNPPAVTPDDNQGITRTNTGGQPSTLPFTGGDVAGLAMIGAAATGAGVVIVRRGRRTA
jgi:hypothetical protein